MRNNMPMDTLTVGGKDFSAAWLRSLMKGWSTSEVACVAEGRSCASEAFLYTFKGHTDVPMGFCAIAREELTERAKTDKWAQDKLGFIMERAPSCPSPKDDKELIQGIIKELDNSFCPGSHIVSCIIHGPGITCNCKE